MSHSKRFFVRNGNFLCPRGDGRELALDRDGRRRATRHSHADCYETPMHGGSRGPARTPHPSAPSGTATHVTVLTTTKYCVPDTRQISQKPNEFSSALAGPSSEGSVQVRIRRCAGAAWTAGSAHPWASPILASTLTPCMGKQSGESFLPGGGPVDVDGRICTPLDLRSLPRSPRSSALRAFPVPAARIHKTPIGCCGPDSLKFIGHVEYFSLRRTFIQAQGASHGDLQHSPPSAISSGETLVSV